ncbi:hypothetical protein MNB_SM-6-1076 [hydrothermal vent metagenome]|uniref:Type IV pilus biogenesis protein PilO n=1 Tax=hydrothermal vent metagenome TaxID=652676 RepID=A0A1W1CSY9_9ZZZZ
MREKIDLLEDKLQSLGIKEKLLIAALIPFTVLLLFYFFYITDAIEKHQNNAIEIAKLNHNLKKHAKETLERKIKLSKKKIVTLKSQIATDAQNLRYLNTKLAQKNFLFLSQKNFTHFLNNLLEKSVKNNFLIQDLKISEQNKNYIEKIKYKRLVTISGSSEFLHTLKFLRAIEETNMLLEIKDLNIETNGTVPYITYNINFYGIEK